MRGGGFIARGTPCEFAVPVIARSNGQGIEVPSSLGCALRVGQHCRTSPAHRGSSARHRPRGHPPALKTGRLLWDERVAEGKTLRAVRARHRSRGSGGPCLDRRVSTCGLASDDVTSWGPGRRRRTSFCRGPGVSGQCTRCIACNVRVRCNEASMTKRPRYARHPRVRNKRLTDGIETASTSSRRESEDSRLRGKRRGVNQGRASARSLPIESWVVDVGRRGPGSPPEPLPCGTGAPLQSGREARVT